MSIARKPTVPNGTVETPDPAETQTPENDSVPNGTEETTPLVDLDAIEPEQPPPPDVNAVIAELATLKPVDYEQKRKDAAVRLGMRASVLDQLVKQARTEQDGYSDGLPGRPLNVQDVAPWPKKVDGAMLLDDISAAIRAYVVMTPEQADIAGTWCVFSHGIDHFPIAPRLAVQSAEKGSGKSTLLDIIKLLVNRGLSAAGVSPASIFRVIESVSPTFLIDEADTILRSDNEELRGILNSGHRKSDATIIRVVGDQHEPREFSTWCPMVTAGIGALPDTLQDRSVVITLKRRRSDEPIKPLRMDDPPEELRTLAQKAARWMQDNGKALSRADPAMPPGTFNRAADNLRPILAIADRAGGEWPERMRKAALSIRETDSEDSIRVRLLTDIRTVFNSHGGDRIPTATLIEGLRDIDGAPWAEFGRGDKGITGPKLAKLLRPYKITPGTRRGETGTFRGYLRSQFIDPWARYCPEAGEPPVQSVTTSQATETAASSGFQSVTPKTDVTLSKLENPRQTAGCDTVTPSQPPTWEGEL